MLSTHFPSLHKPSEATMAALKTLARAAADTIILHRAAMGDVKSMIRRSDTALKDSYRVLMLADLAAKCLRTKA